MDYKPSHQVDTANEEDAAIASPVVELALVYQFL
jgi:hypothetical protein